MDIKLILNPSKVISLKMLDKDIKIVLRGTTPYDEAFIEAPRFKQYSSEREAEKAGREYVRRVLSYTIKDVQGLTYLDESDKLILVHL